MIQNVFILKSPSVYSYYAAISLRARSAPSLIEGATLDAFSPHSLPSDDAPPPMYGTNAGRPTSPSSSNIFASSVASLFAVVSSLSPVNTELAPARNARAWSAGDMVMRPALSRTTVRGITIRATAMARTISNPVGGSRFSSGVPLTGTSALIGTLSGCSGKLARTRSMLARSFSSSPRPKIPPQQTLIPASLTAAIVFSRSS
mmetsp:Transcript_12513/g.57933  ORF Transcript_12513/g.57933 Transcript_12513/m.57933 type:complete len:203 (+) Transcript_12513:2153-2761(+)